MAISVSQDRPRQNLRLEPTVWDRIDSSRRKRPGNVSRNTWITEAIQEKLAREEDRSVKNEAA